MGLLYLQSDFFRHGFVGATVALDIAWSFSDIANGLMAIPNLISLIVLSGILAKDTKKHHADNRLPKK